MWNSKRSVIRLLRSLSIIETQSRCASYSNRESRMLTKLMTGKRKTKFRLGDTLMTDKPKPMFDVKKTPTKVSNRRTIVLNKMFMRHVTDIIASGPLGYELCDLGLEITRVTVCQGYHGLNIFWTATATDNFDLVGQKLESLKKSVRHELHQMQLMGNIPHLTFVRDTQLSYFDNLDAAIAKADYGDDHEPNNSKTTIKSEFDIPNELKSENESIMPMRQDVFGLNHALLMGRIKQSMAKSRQAWKAYETKTADDSTAKPFTFNTSFESIRQEQVTTKQSQDILGEFLVKRKQLRKQLRIEKAEFHEALNARETEEYDGDYENTNDNSLEDESEIYEFYDNYEQYEK